MLNKTMEMKEGNTNLFVLVRAVDVYRLQHFPP